MTLDAVGAWPPITESHVEMDGAWALYEAWLKIQAGHADTALIYGYSKASPGDLPRVLSRQLDPYYYGPLWPDSVALAGLQARAMLDSGKHHRGRDGRHRPPQPRGGPVEPPRPGQGHRSPSTSCWRRTYLSDPLRLHDCPPITRRRRGDHPGRRRQGPRVGRAPGLDPRHRPPDRQPQLRRPRPHRVRRRSSRPARRPACTTATIDVAELHAPFTHQEKIVRDGAQPRRTTRGQPVRRCRWPPTR